MYTCSAVNTLPLCVPFFTMALVALVARTERNLTTAVASCTFSTDFCNCMTAMSRANIMTCSVMTGCIGVKIKAMRKAREVGGAKGWSYVG